MKHEKFIFHDAEKKLHMASEVLWKKSQPRKIRLLLTGERLVLLTREGCSHLLAVGILALIGIVILVSLFSLLDLQGSPLPLILVLIFGIGGNIHLQYRFHNPRLHRVIREIPLSEITELKEVNDVRVSFCCTGNRELTFILPPGELRKLAAVWENCRSQKN